jgi:hypothetical protein
MRNKYARKPLSLLSGLKTFIGERPESLWKFAIRLKKGNCAMGFFTSAFLTSIHVSIMQ